MKQNTNFFLVLGRFLVVVGTVLILWSLVLIVTNPKPNGSNNSCTYFGGRYGGRATCDTITETRYQSELSDATFTGIKGVVLLLVGLSICKSVKRITSK